MSPARATFLVLSISLSGCTVGWYHLNPQSPAGAPMRWGCPDLVNVVVSSATWTRTRGTRSTDEHDLVDKRRMYRQAAEEVLTDHGCNLSNTGSATYATTLQITIEEVQQLSATGEEYLTGLSLGLIPSLSTRPAELRFNFVQGDRQTSFTVDEKRINHILVTPFFWSTFVLESEQREFRNALEQFTSNL